MAIIKLNRSILSLSQHVVTLILLVLFLNVTSAPASGTNSSLNKSELYRSLAEGKSFLDKGDYYNAATKLTEAYDKLPLLGDYALLWRARAFEGKGDFDKALGDLKSIREKFKESPLIKKTRIKEIDISKKIHSAGLENLFDAFTRDYPSDFSIKYDYAIYLKETGETEKAKKLFREIYSSSTSFSKSAFAELSRSDLTLDDLLKRAKNLNNAWLFDEAERQFRDALRELEGRPVTEGKKQKSSTVKLKSENEISEVRSSIKEGLAYSVFRQKRYREASELYKELNNPYWRARSLLRAGDIASFESELAETIKTGDKKTASLLVAYGTKKRRAGDIDSALKIYRDVSVKYPSSKEEALWAAGWTHYLTKNFKNAQEVFSQLYLSYGDPKYLYWKNRCIEISDSAEPAKASSVKKETQSYNFYSFLSLIRSRQKPSAIGKNPAGISLTSSLSERVEVLIALNLKQEAISELIQMTKKNPGQNELIYISSQLKGLDNYKVAINSIAKIPYNDALHELFYPFGFWSSVQEASKKNDIDPLLILAVMREESRFDPEARSIAGAMGLMQLMPQTASRLSKNSRVSFRNTPDLYDAKTNIMLGSYYLRHLVKTFGSIPIALAAYNAGEDIVKEWLKNGNYSTIDAFIEDIPYNETQNYVKKVLTSYFEYMRADGNMDLSAIQKNIGDL